MQTKHFSRKENIMEEIINNFKTIITQKYICFDGRAGRGEFWRFALVSFVVSTVLSFIPKVGPILQLIWILALLLPTLGVIARRLHDRGKSGWLQLLALIPVIGGLIVLILCIPEGDAGENKYGAAE